MGVGIFQLSYGRGGGSAVFMEYKFGFVYYGVASDGEKYRKAVHEGVSQIHVLVHSKSSLKNQFLNDISS